jgi:undecaprenyl pyrophosphate phosphatase UppP
MSTHVSMDHDVAERAAGESHSSSLSSRTSVDVWTLIVGLAGAFISGWLALAVLMRGGEGALGNALWVYGAYLGVMCVLWGLQLRR